LKQVFPAFRCLPSGPGRQSQQRLVSGGVAWWRGLLGPHFRWRCSRSTSLASAPANVDRCGRHRWTLKWSPASFSLTGQLCIHQTNQPHGPETSLKLLSVPTGINAFIGTADQKRGLWPSMARKLGLVVYQNITASHDHLRALRFPAPVQVVGLPCGHRLSAATLGVAYQYHRRGGERSCHDTWRET